MTTSGNATHAGPRAEGARVTPRPTIGERIPGRSAGTGFEEAIVASRPAAGADGGHDRGARG